MLRWIAQDFQGLAIPSPRLDGELILSRVLGLDRVRLYMEMDRPLDAEELAAIKQLVVRRRKHEPMAYILGSREFHGRRFDVTPAVLIPRPDTETLIEHALARLDAERSMRVLDLCTGSGAIAVTLAAERSLLQVDATDLSADALAVAASNAERIGVASRVSFHQGDLFEALPSHVHYDLIVANPPYIPTAEIATLAPDIVSFEPHLALDGGDDGLDVVKRLCREAESYVAPGGSMLLEVGMGQAEHVVQWLQARSAWTAVCAHRDLGGVLRVVDARSAERHEVTVKPEGDANG